MRFSNMDQLVRSWDDRVDYETQYLGESIVGELWRLMESSGLTKADLARRMRRKRSYVTRMFSSGQNLTLRSMAGALAALDARLVVRAESLSEADKAGMQGWCAEVAPAQEGVTFLPSTSFSIPIDTQWLNSQASGASLAPESQEEILQGAA